MDFRLLLDVKRHIEFRLQHDEEDDFLEVLAASIVEILRSGFCLATVFPSDVAANNGEALQKLMDDFEWVRKSAQRHNMHTVVPAAAAATTQPAAAGQSSFTSVEQFLHWWTLRNLKSNCLGACLRELVAEGELLDCYYADGAFLRSEAHSAALFMCLSALELNQCNLLSQVENCIVASTASWSPRALKYRRFASSSQPNFSILPPKILLTLPEENDRSATTITSTTKSASSVCNSQRATSTATVSQVFSTFRRVKSMPVLCSAAREDYSTPPMQTRHKVRPLSMPAALLTGLAASTAKPRRLIALTASSPCSGDDELPTTSTCNRQHRRREASNLTLDSRTNSTATSTSATSSLASLTLSSSSSQRIKLIRCDDIKIWTDQSRQLREQQQQNCTVTAPLPVRKAANGVSPINSFLCQLFGTPPTYTNWSHSSFQLADEAETTGTAIDAIASMPSYSSSQADEPLATSGGGGGVFDAFRAIDGQKLRARKTQNFFDDSANCLEYSTTPTSSFLNSHNQLIATANDSATHVGQVNTHTMPTTITTAAPKDQQSLTAFLQTAQLSRNNTELEKENAHFRIAEAMISVIEHIKWAKLAPEKQRQPSEIPTATEWLKCEPPRQPSQNCFTHHDGAAGATAVVEEISAEHIPYAEVGECCLDLLSAEVVGLSLISKFNDKHLPKVSELKWLVSEDDTPQKLLPMPTEHNNNPDDNFMPSVTRGTQYWAPPRRQIIFTDHPPPNRKALIQKQNNRCAGCGMHVSPAYIHSFRYCTYLGKYHCTGCHRDQIAATPAKILQMWDFKCYPVSVFSYRLLEQMYTFPLFHVPDLNPGLYARAKELSSARAKRVRLKYVEQFIITCRFAVKEQCYFDAIPSYMTAEPDMWSMSDFIDAHQKSLHHSIDELIARCEGHIFNCVLCTARGFLCEHCQKDQIIYPWQNKIVRCDCCAACYHQKCWKSMRETCAKCQRRLNKCEIDINDA